MAEPEALPERPLVSALIVVRDGARFLADAIGSVDAQDYEPLELIVVENGSADDSYEVARRLAPEADVSAHPSLDLAGGRNEAIARARGELIGFLDADDVWPQGRLTAMVAALQESPGAGLVAGSVETFHCPLLDAGERAELPPARGPQPALIAGSTLLRREPAAAAGPFRSEAGNGEFGEWLMRFRLAGLEELRVERTVLRRRLHTASATFAGRGDNSDYARAMLMGLRARRAAESGRRSG